MTYTSLDKISAGISQALRSTKLPDAVEAQYLMYKDAVVFRHIDSGFKREYDAQDVALYDAARRYVSELVVYLRREETAVLIAYQEPHLIRL